MEGYSKLDIVLMLELVKAELKAQGRITDDRLEQKKRKLEQLILNWERIES